MKFRKLLFVSMLPFTLLSGCTLEKNAKSVTESVKNNIGSENISLSNYDKYFSYSIDYINYRVDEDLMMPVIEIGVIFQAKDIEFKNINVSLNLNLHYTSGSHSSTLISNYVKFVFDKDLTTFTHEVSFSAYGVEDPTNLSASLEITYIQGKINF